MKGGKTFVASYVEHKHFLVVPPVAMEEIRSLDEVAAKLASKIGGRLELESSEEEVIYIRRYTVLTREGKKFAEICGIAYVNPYHGLEILKKVHFYEPVEKELEDIAKEGVKIRYHKFGYSIHKPSQQPFPSQCSHL